MLMIIYRHVIDMLMITCRHVNALYLWSAFHLGSCSGSAKTIPKRRAINHICFFCAQCTQWVWDQSNTPVTHALKHYTVLAWRWTETEKGRERWHSLSVFSLVCSHNIPWVSSPLRVRVRVCARARAIARNSFSCLWWKCTFSALFPGLHYIFIYLFYEWSLTSLTILCKKHNCVIWSSGTKFSTEKYHGK